jgi:virulence factor Mce-like protein
MRRTTSPNEHFRIGLVTLLIIAAATYLGFTKRLPWTDEWQIKAVVSDAQELNKGAQVRIAGVAVGKVASVKRGPAGTAVVTMNIDDKGRPLHRDATLTVRPRLFLEGNFFIDLKPGSPSAAALDDGETIPLGQTATAVRLDSVLKIFEADARDNVQDGLREYAEGLSGGGATAFNDALPDAAPAFLGVARTMSALRGERRDDLSAWLRESSRIAAGFAENDRALAGLVTGFARTVGATAEHSDDLAATLTEFADLASRAPAPLAELARALPAVRRLAAQARPALRAAPATLDASRPFLAAVDRIVDPRVLPAFAHDVRPLAGEIRAIAPPLQTLLGRVDRVAQCVSSNIVPVLQSSVDDGRLSSGQPVWKELVRASVGLTSASQNFDGNGADLRYSLGVGDQTVSLGQGTTTGDLFARVSDPLLGSRPQMPAKAPPQRPDVPCAGQRRPNLATDASPPPPTQPAPPLKLSPKHARALQRLIDGTVTTRR